MFVRSRLEYALIVWNPWTSLQINRIERVQRKFIKFALLSLNFDDPIPSYESRCKLIRLQPLLNRRCFQSVVFIYKVICGLLDCSHILDLIGFNVPLRRLRNFEMFYVPCHRTNYGMNEPIVRALREFNKISLNHNIEFNGEISEFKKLLENVYY